MIRQLEIKPKWFMDASEPRMVKYTSKGGDKEEYGYITSFNEKFIFVRYHTQLKPEIRIRTGTTSEATDPEDLEWA